MAPPPHRRRPRRRPAAWPLALTCLALLVACPPLAAQQQQRRPATRPAAASDAPFAIGRRPPLAPVAPAPAGLTDEQVGKAIARATAFLLSRFDADGVIIDDRRRGPDGAEGQGPLPPRGNPNAPVDRSYHAGMNALAVYALLQAGLASHDERLGPRGDLARKLIDSMKRMDADGHAATYARGIRATALALHNRPEDRQALADDALYLLGQVRGGCYTYGRTDWRNVQVNNRMREGDNSNAQYGLLGVWSAAEVGAEVPLAYWRMVEDHWTEAQLENGMWNYHPATPGNAARGGAMGRGTMPGTYTMTMAGLASLFVTHDYLDAPRFAGQVGRDPFSPALAQGLAWLEQGDNCLGRTPVRRPGADPAAPPLLAPAHGYGVYGLERVGLASGFKYFGAHDWYRTIAAELVARQAANGSWAGPWGGPAVETSYCLLFLARGRHPILMNKLRFDGYWANRPRDAANLARFATRELERPLNWQVVPLNRRWQDWADSPILSLASHQPPRLADKDLASIKAFIDAGGLLFTHADGNARAFTTFVVNQLARKLYPQYEFVEVPASHELYTIHFKVDPKAAGGRLKALSNGSRLLIVHAEQDVAQHWQLRADRTRRASFELGVNLFLYAAGKQTRLMRNRLEDAELAAPDRRPTSTIRLARARYAGNHDPEPYAFVRFARHFHRTTGAAVAVETVDLAALDAAAHPVAHLTGTAPHTPTDAEAQAIRRYVEAGGVLLIDACGGATAFGNAVEDSILAKAFPGAKTEPLAGDHPLSRASAPGMEDLGKLELRPGPAAKLGRIPPKLRTLKAGKGRVIYSPLDLTTALLDTRHPTVTGYTSASAMAVVTNVILWTWDGAKE